MRPHYAHELVINGTNMKNYGLTLRQGSVKNTLVIPKYKDVKSTDWQESDGLEVDLSSPVFQRREFDLTLCGPSARMAYQVANDTCEYASISVTNTPINLSKCRVTRITQYSTLDEYAFSTMRITSDDDPAAIISQHSSMDFPSLPYIEPVQFLYDGAREVNFGAIGVRVLKGWYGQANMPAAVKQGLERDISTIAGKICDSHNGNPTFQSKTLSLSCLLHAGTNLDEFWSRYLNFLYRLTRPGGCLLEIDGIDNTYMFDGLTVGEYIPCRPAPWMKFNLNLVKID